MVVAKGWRFQPWGLRAIVVIVAVVLFLFYYSLFGPPFNPAAGLPYLLILVVVVPAELYFELQSLRTITVVPSGIAFNYPLRKSFVPWDRLEFCETQLPHWSKTVTFLEIGRKSGLRQLAHRVTVQQARAILAAMPTPPADPRALMLLNLPSPPTATT